MNDFYRVCLPEPFTVLGLRLRPFSIGHKILMARIENAFEVGGQLGIADLVTGVLICSKKYSEFEELLNSGKFVSFVNDWQRKLCYKFSLFGNSFLLREIDWPEKTKLFIEYLAEGNKIPPYIVDSKQSGKSGMPLVQLVRSCLISHCGYSNSEVMDTPWNMALMDFLTYYEKEGAVVIEDRDATTEAMAGLADFTERLKRGEVKV